MAPRGTNDRISGVMYDIEKEMEELALREREELAQREREEFGLNNNPPASPLTVSPESPSTASEESLTPFSPTTWTAPATYLPTYPTAPTPGFPKVLTLDISGHMFKVSRDILVAGSGLFALQLSDRFTWEPQADGSYFMDADPELFEHLVRFMRRPESYPLFYDQAKGFDYDLYRRLEAEAAYFQVHPLTEWIRSEKYLQAVKTTSTDVHSRVVGDVTLLHSDIRPVLQNRIQQYHFIPRIIKSYVCPRGIHVHMGQKDKCGIACSKARGGLPDEYEDKFHTQIILVDKQVVFDRAICEVE